MSEAPQVVRVYRCVLVAAMTLVLLSDLVAGGFSAKALVSSVPAMGLALGIWFLLFRHMLRVRSNAARWALVILTFPLGLLLLAPSAARHCSSRDRRPVGGLLLSVLCFQIVHLPAADVVTAASAGALPDAGGGKEGRTWVEPVTGMELVFVEGGCFQMGMSEKEASELEKEVGKVRFDHNYRGELPRHEVCVRGFWIGRHEVTNRQFRLWRPGHDSLERRGRSLNGDGQPAVMVSAEDAEGFLAWLSGEAKRSFRLPTEAEWEYAARSGGREEKYAGFSRTADLHLYANFCDAGCWGMSRTEGQDDGFAVTAPVGTFRPNGLGLHDMTGNAEEWCSDWYDRDYYRESPREDPKGPPGPGGPLKERVQRGGSWIINPRNMRAASRHKNGFAVGRHFDGFRVVMEADPR